MRPKFQIPIEQLRKRSIFLATPMYGGQCAGPFAKAVQELTTFCTHNKINLETYYLFNESLITRARNYLVDHFLKRSKCTHLLFIDSDIAFSFWDVLALLTLDKPIIGGPYPKKTIAWEKIYDAVNLGLVKQENVLELDKYAGDFVFNVAPGTTEFRVDQPVEVLEIGTGFMMVQREVFEKWQAAYPDRAFKPDHNRSKDFDGTQMCHAFFDTVIDPETKRYLSEDYMFCQYARKAGIPVYLCPWMEMQHIGMHIYSGSIQAMADLSHKQAAAGQVTQVGKS